MKIKIPKLVHKPIEAQPVTLADVPNVNCVVYCERGELLVRAFDGTHVREVNRFGNYGAQMGSAQYAKEYTVIQRLDGKPLPQPKLPKTLADDGVEEGRLYGTSYGVLGVIGSRLIGCDNMSEEFRSWGCASLSEYPIKRATDYIIEIEEHDI